MTLPNLITLLRLASTPLLLALAWHGQGTAFLVLLAAGFGSDVLDGWLARRLGQSSELGARLDSLCDLAVYVTVALGGWWLWPELLRAEAPFFAALLASLVLPGVLALVRFRRLTSYHTWLAKIAVAAAGLSVLLLFAGGPAWPLRLAVPLGVAAALEAIAITLLLREPASNVRSLWHLLRARSGSARD